MTPPVSSSFERLPGTTGATLIFAPSRSRIDNASPLDETTAVLGWSERTVRVSWVRVDEFDSTSRSEISVEFSGEAPSLLAIAWRGLATTNNFFDGPEGAGLTDEMVYRVRESWTYDREHAFMFEIDRRTNLSFIEFAEIPPAEHDYTRRTVEKLTSSFDRVLESRHPKSDIARESVADELVEHYSDIVWKASDLLFAPGAEISERERTRLAASTFRNFAAGRLRRRTTLRKPGVKFLENFEADTNSYLVYLFAELGLAAFAMGSHRDRWRAILPSLVRMQLYFNARVSMSVRQNVFVNQYNYPPPYPLDREDRRRLDIRSARLDTYDIKELEHTIADNLLDLGSEGFRYTSS